MTTDPARTPVILATGQTIERDDTVSCVDLMARAVDTAFAEAPGARDRLDRVITVDVLNDRRERPASELVDRLGLGAVPRATTTVGGNTPQWLVTRVASDIAEGRADTVLLAGAEVGRSRKLGGHEDDRGPDEPADEVLGVDRFGLGEAELSVGLTLPIHVYPMFEGTLAARAGRGFEEQRRFLGELMAPFTSVAAKHPYAWFPVERTPEELSTVTEDNRLIAEPYTKLLNAIMAVDQGAALVLTSLATAARLGLADQAVFVWSGADAADVWFPSQRPDLSRSAGISLAGGAALDAAGTGVDEIAHLDFYSCFPAAVQCGAEALGVALDDPRGLTVAGGLPYFGGPGNNYPMHSIATAVGLLREGGGTALTTGLGWYVTKHSVGIYGAEPPPNGFRRGVTDDGQRDIEDAAMEVALEAEGRATVDASTVIYERDGSVAGAPVFATLDDGRRIVATAHPDELGRLAGRSLVGTTVTVTGRPPTYRLEEDPR